MTKIQIEVFGLSISYVLWMMVKETQARDYHEQQQEDVTTLLNFVKMFKVPIFVSDGSLGYLWTYVQGVIHESSG